MSDMRFDPHDMWAKMKKNSDGLISTATGIRSFIRSTRRELPAIQATGHVFIQN